MNPPPGHEHPPDDEDGRAGIPVWLWLALSCLLGLAAALVILHLAGAARDLPG